LVGDEDIEAGADELVGQRGLHVAEADDQFGLQRHDLVDLAVKKGTDARLLLAGAARPHNHFQALLSARRLSFATALLLAGALCIHSLLEGMALGAQPALRGAEDIFLAIVAHKGLAAYALGASIVESRASDAKFWLTAGLFALATPVGIGLGYASSTHGGAVGAAVSALAAGTFVYVALMEVVPKELEDGRHRGAKMAAMLLGFGLMSLLAVWA
jgi:zinc transporter 1/2/3